MNLKKYFCLGILLLSLLTGCKDSNMTGLAVKTQTQPTIERIIGQPSTAVDEISIGTFNIQIFGKKKREKDDVMKRLVDIVDDYDIIAIQEFRDKTEETVPYFLSKINEKEGNNYSVIASERLGRSSSKERYAFYYDNKRIEFLNLSFTFPDTEDLFEREPFIAYFKAKEGNFDFYLVNIHTKPDDVEKEIRNLAKVKAYILQKHPEDGDVIFLGDFNADGNYFNEESDVLGEQYFWAVPNDFDTTVARSDRTFDRIIFLKEFTLEDFAYKSGVDRFEKRWPELSYDEMKKISDHYPVWVKFRIDKDSQ
ncbi:MAG TPA: hypothetical protein ENF94_02100 [Candidatus Woesearchaeota archaeon]|nr:hypothetical protein [Candidatus Woesearchaeota archaeon]